MPHYSPLHAAPHHAALPLFGSFRPLPGLWQDDGRLFLSRASAQWFIRVHRNELVKAKALAMHTGRLYYDPARFAAVVEAVAVSAAA